jgi:ADP-heptose:LPS heptosyltransferase
MTDKINSIAVIVGLDLVGDALLKLPFLRALRAAFPQAKISWLTSQGKTFFNGPLRNISRSLIDDIHEQPAWLATTQHPASGTAPHFDLIIDTRNRWQDALLARKIPHHILIAMAWRYLLSDRRPPLLQPKKSHLVDRLLQMVELASGQPPQLSGKLPLDENLMHAAAALLPDGKKYIGFAPGAGNKIKIWPLENFIAEAQLQVAAGRVPVFILGPDEMIWQEKIAAGVPAALFPLQQRQVWGSEKIKIDETVALGSRLTLAVTNDSGTSHMLAAANCPLISLFGPTDAAKLAPRVTYRRVLRAQDFGSSTAMAAIPLRAVGVAIEELIEQITDKSK